MNFGLNSKAISVTLISQSAAEGSYLCQLIRKHLHLWTICYS